MPGTRPVVTLTDVFPNPMSSGNCPEAGRRYKIQRKVEHVLPEQVAAISATPAPLSQLREWSMWQGGRIQHGPRLPWCIALFGAGAQVGPIEGRRGHLHRKLFDVSPPADPTQVSIVVDTGHYTVAGDGEHASLRLDEGDELVLDPERLTADEWVVTRPASGSSTYRYRLVIGETPAFVLQRFAAPADPQDEPVLPIV